MPATAATYLVIEGFAQVEMRRNDGRPHGLNGKNSHENRSYSYPVLLGD